MKIDNLFTEEELKKAVLNMQRLLQNPWIEITGASFSSVFPNKLMIRFKVENNVFYRTINADGNILPKDCIELPVAALARDEAFNAFWIFAEAMHAETPAEAIERRLKALEAKLEIK